jgi:hypothetical protein
LERNGTKLHAAQLTLGILLNEASLLDCSYDFLAQVAAETVPSTLAPAAIAWMALLKEIRLITGLMELYLGQRTGSNGKVLVHCKAGCLQDAVIAALKARGLWQLHCVAEQIAPIRPRYCGDFETA